MGERRTQQNNARTSISTTDAATTTNMNTNMNTSILPPLARKVVERYVRAFAPERIILFGSFAKGMNHDHSDIDLLIVSEVEGSRHSVMRRARQLAADCFPPVDVVFASPEEVAEADRAASPFLASILEKGIVLYKAALHTKCQRKWEHGRERFQADSCTGESDNNPSPENDDQLSYPAISVDQ